MSQAQLAALSGVAPSNISAYESGRRRASAAMTKRILDSMTRPTDRLRAHREEVLTVIARCGGENPRVFGSVARGEDTPTSDLDIVVRVRPGAAWEFVSMARCLDEVLGVSVDVVSEAAIGPKHAAILAEAVPL
jgi:predicted nucleotidyltransferase